MTTLVLSGLTTITTFQIFDGWDQLSEDINAVFAWIHSKLPENKFTRFVIYTTGTLALLRAIPFIFRRTAFFQFYEEQSFFFHRSCNHPEVLKMKDGLLSDIHNLPRSKNGKLIILELNMGSGTNASYYPADSYIIGTDFINEEQEKIEKNFLVGDERRINLDRFIHTRVEELRSVPDQSVSCVVSFHSLCSARKVGRALAEIRRVLVPKGRLYFIEHTEEKEYFTLLWLQQLNFRPSMFMLGCCIYSPESYIENAGFSKVSYRTTKIDLRNVRGPQVSLSPHIYGYAVK